MRFLSREAGQARRAWLDDKTEDVAEALRYYLGPGFSEAGAGVVNALGYMNPVNDIGEAMAAGRDGEYVNMLTHTATAAAPVVAGKIAKAYNPRMADDAAQWLEDALMGVSVNPTAASLKAAPGQFVADEAGNIPIASKQITPAQRQAQDVLDLLTTGRADEVTDDMLAAADDMYLFDNYDLPMDTPSRMKRADALGYDMWRDFYHGTAKDGLNDSVDIHAFERDRIGDRWNADTEGFSITSSLQDANYYTRPFFNDRAEPEAAVYPLMDSSGNLYDMPMTSLDGTISKWDQRQEGFDGWLRDSSHDGARMYDRGNDIEMRVVSDPKNLRSRFARFDPRLKHLANLSAAGAGIAYLTPQEEAEIRAYLGE